MTTTSKRLRSTSPPVFVDQRTTAPIQPPPPRTQKAKRARASLPASETVQVTALESCRLPLADADVRYRPGFVSKPEANDWYEQLCHVDGWYQPTLKMYGKEITQSRKIAAYATDPELVVKYSGQIVKMQYEYPPLLREIQDRVEAELGVTFNHCMMNWYEDGKVYIGPHRDNKENRVIASLSLGVPRTFILAHTAPPAPPPLFSPPPSTPSQLYKKSWMLDNGSLVVMQGETQKYWKHEIPKEPKIKTGRISLTFRQLVF